ncbi:putative phytochelatin synthase [Nostoc sp. NIES-4103]|nr:putative phytochelatin synthase [Nostoc sp. NIES-4103]
MEDDISFQQQATKVKRRGNQLKGRVRQIAAMIARFHNCQKGGGYISLIAACCEKMDKFLILDVSTYKYPPVRVSASTLWNVMNTFDAASKKTRGYLIVKKYYSRA